MLICSLAAARELVVSVYDGVITIEDTTIEEPFRVEDNGPQQLVLRFDDISVNALRYLNIDSKIFGNELLYKSGGQLKPG